MSRRIFARAAAVLASTALIAGGAAVASASSAAAATPQSLQFYSCSVEVQADTLLGYADFYQNVTVLADSVVDAQAFAAAQVGAWIPWNDAVVSAACVAW